MKEVPVPPARCRAEIDPPKRSMVAWHKASPSPVPSPGREVVKNGSNRLRAAPGGQARPLAVHYTNGAPPSARPPHSTPRAPALGALSNRLNYHCTTDG